MPGFNGSGPMGAGPMTGGARGYCTKDHAGYGSPGGYGRSVGCGLGFKGGYGSGRRGMRVYGRGRRPSVADYTREPGDELNRFRQQADAIQKTLDSINSRIAGLEKTD